MPEKLCPYCDSARTQRLANRSYEAESGVTWFECASCRRIWHLEKVPVGEKIMCKPKPDRRRQSHTLDHWAGALKHSHATRKSKGTSI